MGTLVSFGPTQDIADANNRPLGTLSTIKMPVKLGRFVAAAEYIVCEKLAVPLILSAGYCDRFVVAIHPRKETIELANFSKVPIVRRFSARIGKKNLVPGEDENDEKGERFSPKVKLVKATTIEPGTQHVVECTSKRAGLVVFQPYSSLYEKHGLICTNGAVQVEPYRPFRLLVANFRKYPVRVQKRQVVAELLLYPRAVLESKTTIGEVLGIQGRQEENFLITPRCLRARQDADRRNKIARTSQKIGLQGCPRRHLRSHSAGLSRHRRMWMSST